MALRFLLGFAACSDRSIVPVAWYAAARAGATSGRRRRPGKGGRKDWDDWLFFNGIGLESVSALLVVRYSGFFTKLVASSDVRSDRDELGVCDMCSAAGFDSPREVSDTEDALVPAVRDFSDDFTEVPLEEDCEEDLRRRGTGRLLVDRLPT